MNYNLSGCVFIKNCFKGAFALFESMASFLPFVTEIIVMDLGSDDGTLEVLQDIASHNNKVRLVSGTFYKIDANVFATLANDLIAMCTYDNVLYWQADEIWHEDLLRLMEQRFEAGQFDLSFWRIQYANNFQYVKWYPHLIHVVGQRGNFNFIGDGMNTDRVWDARICSNFGGEMFPRWGELGPEDIKPFVNEMSTDVSLIGGFRDNIPDRRRMHAPFWHEEPTIPYYLKESGQQPHLQESAWYARALGDEDWTKPESPYNLPKLLKYHVGRVKYELRPDLLDALRRDKTREFIGI